MLPLTKHYLNYPINTTREDGLVSGHTGALSVNNWKLSSDVGCAFIMLDGITAAYEVTKDERLKETIKIIIEKFLSIDYIKLHCQTHATLSCARGILRFYENTQEEKYLNYAINIFDDYIKNGMTYDYENINWFGRKDSWTEPCCIVDSLILSKKLYLITNKIDYLNLFNRVYINAMRSLQRNNGGAGCCTCAVDDSYIIKNHLYEAFFCCTMRIGEGFYELHDFSLKKINDSFLVPFVNSFEYMDNEIAFTFDYDIYNSHQIKINVSKIDKLQKMFIYVPKLCKVQNYNAKNGLIELKLNNIGEIIINFELNITKENDFFYIGDMLLTRKNQKSTNSFLIDGRYYSPLYDNILYGEDELNKLEQYVK